MLDEIPRRYELLAGINPCDLHADILDERERGDACFCEDASAAPHVDGVRYVDGGTNRFAQTVVERVCGDADDLQPTGGAGCGGRASGSLIDEVGRFDGVTDGVAVGPILARHRLIDDGEGGGAHRSGVIPHAALHERNTQQRKIFGADEIHADFGRAKIGVGRENRRGRRYRWMAARHCR